MKNSQGFVMVEFLLVLPVLMFILLVIGKLGDIYWKKLVLAHAVYASVEQCARAKAPDFKPDDYANAVFVKNSVKGAGFTTNSPICNEYTDSGIKYVSFTGQFNYEVNVLEILKKNIVVNETATMVKEDSID